MTDHETLRRIRQLAVESIDITRGWDEARRQEIVRLCDEALATELAQRATDASDLERAEALLKLLPIISPVPMQSGQTITATVTHQSFGDPKTIILAAIADARQAAAREMREKYLDYHRDMAEMARQKGEATKLSWHEEIIIAVSALPC